MPSRKRNLSPDFNTHISTNLGSSQESAKRLRLASHAPGNRIGEGIPKPKNSRVDSKPEYYTIKSILKEKRGRYLIDWEDDLGTGEQFKPTWVRAHCYTPVVTLPNHSPPNVPIEITSRKCSRRVLINCGLFLGTQRPRQRRGRCRLAAQEEHQKRTWQEEDREHKRVLDSCSE